ncbi:hypothetical protein F5880DRAFT_1602486 [Lentinula raphanica]|nr:hypothetical protein F5880DRAFT_1602486 [Lentinula raphanica]
MNQAGPKARYILVLSWLITLRCRIECSTTIMISSIHPARKGEAHSRSTICRRVTKEHYRFDQVSVAVAGRLSR